MIKISELPSATALGGTEVVAGVQSGVTVKVLASQIGTYVRALFTTTPATIAEGGTGAATAALARASLGSTAVGDAVFIAANAAAGRTALGVAIGSDVQAYDADIATVAASQVEMETGTEAALRSMSPLRVAQAIAAASATIPTGATFDYVGSSAPSGYVLLDGKTIGNGSSGGTERANADTVDLFTLLWNSMADAEAAVSGGRGASAAADFAANKTLTLPDARGRTIAGKDDMGGSTASRLTNAGAGIIGTTLGVAGGSQTHTLITAELASHDHSGVGSIKVSNTGGPAIALSNGTSSADATASGGDTSRTQYIGTVATGSGNAHNNTQPTLVLNKIIKL